MYAAADGERYYVFDCHTHLGASPVFATYGLPTRFTPDDMAGLMARHGVDAVCGFPPVEHGSDYAETNAFNLRKARRQHGGRIHALVRVNPLRPGQVSLRDYVGLGAVGLKLHPRADGGYVVNDRRLVYPVLEEARAAGCRVVLVHSGGHPGSTPALIADAALDFKDLHFIVGHSGYEAGLAEAIAFGRRVENLWLDTAGLEFPFLVTRLVREVGRDRVLYGSDAPFGAFPLEIAKIAEHAALTRDEIRAVLGENLRRLLALPPR